MTYRQDISYASLIEAPETSIFALRASGKYATPATLTRVSFPGLDTSLVYPDSIQFSGHARPVFQLVFGRYHYIEDIHVFITPTLLLVVEGPCPSVVCATSGYIGLEAKCNSVVKEQRVALFHSSWARKQSKPVVHDTSSRQEMEPQAFHPRSLRAFSAIPRPERSSSEHFLLDLLLHGRRSAKNYPSSLSLHITAEDQPQDDAPGTLQVSPRTTKIFRSRPPSVLFAC